MIDNRRIQHPKWSRTRHLALPMLLSWMLVPISFGGPGLNGQSWFSRWGLVVLSVLVTGYYIRGVWLNYRHVVQVLERGRCVACDYDLCGTILANGWECPECGERIMSGMAERVLRRQQQL